MLACLYIYIRTVNAFAFSLEGNTALGKHIQENWLYPLQILHLPLTREYESKVQ